MLTPFLSKMQYRNAPEYIYPRIVPMAYAEGEVTIRSDAAESGQCETAFVNSRAAPYDQKDTRLNFRKSFA